MIFASGRVPELTGKACICRGPLVYCFEGVDNDGDVLSLRLKSELKAELTKVQVFDDIPALSVEALRSQGKGSLYFRERPKLTEMTAKAIPYFCWANRGETQMRIWLPIVY